MTLIKMFVDQKMATENYADAEIFERSKSISNELVCMELDAKRGIISDEAIIHSNKIFIEYIHLGAIKTSISFQLERKSFEIDISDPRKGFGAVNLVYSLLANAASITDSNINFKELILLDIFITQDMLVKQLSKNYARQGIM